MKQQGMIIQHSGLERDVVSATVRRASLVEQERQPGIAVQLHGVGKAYGEKTILNGINLTIPPGELVAIVGRSGSGKSTLLRLLAGLDKVSGGAVAYDGVSGVASDNGIREDVRVMFQDSRLLPWKKVLANVALGLPRSRHQEARGVLEQVGLADRAGDWPAHLSGGQRQRVALARALVHKPRLLLLDEPLGALDALTRIEMHALIERIWRANGFTALLVTHDPAEAITLADRVLLVEDGAIAMDLRVDLPRPRASGSAAFAALQDRLLRRLLQSDAAAPVAEPVQDPADISLHRSISQIRWAI
jgi:sulfonate transport system ATP-binding protein